MKDGNPYLSLLTVLAVALLALVGGRVYPSPGTRFLEERLAREFEKVKAERLVAPVQASKLASNLNWPRICAPVPPDANC